MHKLGKRLGQTALLAAAMMMTAQPLLADWSTQETNRQRLVGVDRNGNPSQRLGTRRGTGKLLVYRDNMYSKRPSIVLLLGKGRVRNRTRFPAVFTGLPTRISLNRKYSVQGVGNAVILGWPWTTRHYNTTTAYWEANNNNP